MSGTATTDTIAVTVHGTRGAVDLVVPLGATISDVAAEYARQARLAHVPVLLTSTGRRLPPSSDLATERLVAGDVLVATDQALAPQPSSATADTDALEGQAAPGVTAWFVAAGVCAGIAGMVAARFGENLRYSAAAVLLVAAVMGVLPLGRYVVQRGAVAPAFAGAFGFAVAYAPGAAGLPLAVGVAALAAAVCAAVARALGEERVDAHDVWIASGLVTFLVAGAGVLIGASPQVVWALLLVLALLAARFVPGFAIDVPDQLLIDLERLAVSAWSARDRTTGRRGRTVVPPAAVAELLARGGQLVTAAAAASAVITLVAVPALLGTASTDIDRQGAQALVFFVGGGFLLAARSYRHAAARVLLRLAGVWAWAGLATAALAGASAALSTGVALGALVVALVVVPVALATGRGWRSVWWARWAELSEALCGALALGSLVVASGLFRTLWE